MSTESQQSTESAAGSRTWAEAPDLLTPTECARLLRVSKTSTYESLRSGDLKAIARRFNRKYLIPKAALRRLIEGEEATDES